MEDLELENTEEYDELSNLESSISYILDDFQSLYNELNDAYDDMDDSENEEEDEIISEYIEDLENQKPSGGKLNSDNFSGGRKRRKRHEN
jgi:DNA-binding ferritin-like protein